jgi:type IV secretory pathway VirB4 component
MAVVMVAVTSVAHRQLYDRAVPGYLVLDESWAVLQSPAAASWLRGSWKLSRAMGVSHIVVVHRIGDLSLESPTALSVLRDCDTHIVHRQRPADLAELANLISLSPRDERTIADLGRGSAFVHYGAARSIVTWSPVAGYDITDTDGAMRAT